MFRQSFDLRSGVCGYTFTCIHLIWIEYLQKSTITHSVSIALYISNMFYVQIRLEKILKRCFVMFRCMWLQMFVERLISFLSPALIVRQSSSVSLVKNSTNIYMYLNKKQQIGNFNYSINVEEIPSHSFAKSKRWTFDNFNK